MSSTLHDLLVHRAESVSPPAFDPREVIVRGEARTRRRHRRAAATGALVIAVTIVLTVAVVHRRHEQTLPTDRTGPVPSWTPGTRPVTYGQGQTLHLGGRTIDTGIDFLSIDVTDNGAALTTVDGGIWFSDGQTLEHVGRTLGLTVRPRSVTGPAGRPRGWVVSDTTGSLLAWLEYRDGTVDHPELVTYDSAARRVLQRVPIDITADTSASALALAGREVLVAETPRGSDSPRSVHRWDVDTGQLDVVDAAYVETAGRRVTRALSIGGSAGRGTLIDWDGDTTGIGTPIPARDHRLQVLVDPRTGKNIRLDLPTGLAAGTVWVVQWVDDDRFTVIVGGPAPVGDLLVCRITAERCQVVIDGTTWTSEPLLPGSGGVGAELAEMRAMQAVLASRSP